VGAAANNGRAAPTKAAINGAWKGAKDGKKGPKSRPHLVAIVAGNEEAGDSSEEFIAAAECHFKRQTQPPKDHFEKLLEVTRPHHPYPIKHKLKDCTMMKKFMMSGTFSKGGKPGGDQEGKVQHPFPGKQKS
jgi:hypothetical protein